MFEKGFDTPWEGIPTTMNNNNFRKRATVAVPIHEKRPLSSKARKPTTSYTQYKHKKRPTVKPIHRTTPVQAFNTEIRYFVSNHNCGARHGSLVDRGANGGVAGDDVRIINKSPDRCVDIQGIDNHQIQSVPIVTAGGVISTQYGEVIAILHQYAYHGKGKTIHSSGQIEMYKNVVDEKSKKVGGSQRICTNDGYVIPINVCDGLPYLKIRPYTDDEFERLPHVILTSDVDWDPNTLDHSVDDDDEWHDAAAAHTPSPSGKTFSEVGEYRNRVTVHGVDLHSNDQEDDLEIFYAADEFPMDIDEIIDKCAASSDEENTNAYHVYPHDDKDCHVYFAHPTEVTATSQDFDQLRPLFGWLPVDIIKKTFKRTTQYARTTISTVMKKHYRSPFPALNVFRRDEPVATDTVYSDTPAIDDGATCAQIFVGTKSLVTDVYGMKTDKEFVNTLEDNIRERGAMNKLISDRAQSEVSNKVLDILRALCIDDWQSEPHQQQQNPAERRYQNVKQMSNTMLDRTGAPASTWLLCMQYVTFILNHSYNATIDAVPLQVATGSTCDISPLLRFTFWEKVYFKHDDSDFPSDTKEGSGRFVGIAQHVGHAMTFMILTDDTQKVIFRSGVRTATDPTTRNLRLDPIIGETSPHIIKSRHDNHATSTFVRGEKKDSNKTPDGEKEDGETTEAEETMRSAMPVFNASDLVGRSFLMEPQEDGQRHRAKILQAIEEYDDDLSKQPENRKFICSVNNEKYEEILSYNEILQFIEKDQYGSSSKLLPMKDHSLVPIETIRARDTTS